MLGSSCLPHSCRRLKVIHCSFGLPWLTYRSPETLSTLGYLQARYRWIWNSRDCRARKDVSGTEDYSREIMWNHATYIVGVIDCPPRYCPSSPRTMNSRYMFSDCRCWSPRRFLISWFVALEVSYLVNGPSSLRNFLFITPVRLWIRTQCNWSLLPCSGSEPHFYERIGAYWQYSFESVDWFRQGRMHLM